MERYDLQTLPALLGHPGPWDYFWQRLPYALPGFLTFLIGGCLAVFALSALRGRTRPVGLLVSAAVLFFTVCTLGLALALRSVVLDAGFLLMLHYCLYAVIPALLPASFALIYFTTDKAYPVAKYAAWALLPTWFFVLWELANGTAFSGRWMFYAFGNYPQGGLSLTVWGVAGAASYLFIGLPIWINVIRKIQSGTFKNSGRLNIPFVVGLNLLWILIVGNLPALLGIGVYPPAFFLFIPLLLLSYGIFRSDFLDLNDFLFQRHGVFYLMSGALALVFVGIGAAVAWGLSAGDFVGKPWHGAMVPLVSVVTTFSLGIFIGGVNPGHRTNQLGSASLFIAGFISLFVMIEFLGLDLVVSYRLRQLSWIVIAFVLSVHFRFAFAAMGKSPPSIRWFFDGASVVISLLATTPLLLAGSYAFPFAMVAAAGPLMSIQAALQAVMIGIALYYYWQVRGSLNNPLGGRVALATLLFGVLGLLSVPAALGFPVYSLGSLQFIPGLIIAHAVLRHGVIPVHRQALAITQRLSASLLVVVPVSIMFFSAWLPAGAPVAERLFYLVLVALPLFLAGYIVVFILAKPVAERLDASYLAVARERHTAEEARRELEQLNLFTRQLSASTDLDVIVDQVTRYVEDHYGFQYTVIYLMDAARHELYSYRASRENPGWTSDHKRYLSRIRYALDGEDLAAKVHWKRRPIYIPNVTASTKLTPHEKEITDTIGLRSVFMVPLMVNDEPVGQVHFVNNEPMSLAGDQRKSIALFCAQISAAINNARLLQEREAARLRAETADFEKTTFFENISHELRTPLTLISGPIQSARRRGEPLSADTMDMILANTARLSRLVGQLLDIQKVQAGKMQLALEPLRVPGMLSEAVSAFAPYAQTQGVTIAEEIAPNLPPVMADPEKLDRCIYNYLSNALKFTPRGGTITVRAFSVEDNGRSRVRIEVRDTGTGIDPDRIGGLFTRFGNSEVSKTDGSRGTGLGLALVKELVELHGGTVGLESSLGQGSVFWLTIPGASAEDAAAAPPETVLSGRGSMSSEVAVSLLSAPVTDRRRSQDRRSTERRDSKDRRSGGDRRLEAKRRARGNRLLIVEDNVDLRNYMKGVFEREGYNVFTAENGEEGLSQIAAVRPEAVVTDLMMPRMTGVEMIANLRQSDEQKTIPVVLLTAKADTRTREEVREAGADGYLSKPFSEAELLATVRNLVALKGREKMFVTELEHARRIQQNLLPSTLPERAGIDFAALYQPMELVGGDFYDFINLPDGGTGILIADVSGHGMPASMIASIAKVVTSMFGTLIFSPSELLAYINEQLYGKTANNFVTAWYGIVNPEGNRLRYTSAGHPEALLLRKGQVTGLRARGKALGWLPSIKLVDHEMELDPGDLVCVYTDGITDELNDAGEPFGEGRVAEALVSLADRRLPDQLEGLMGIVRNFHGKSAFKDDITLVSFRRGEQGDADSTLP